MHTTITCATITLSAYAVTRICFQHYETAVRRYCAAGTPANGAAVRKWGRRVADAVAGNRRLVDAVIRWL